MEIHPQLDIQGPTRPDPDLDSAPSTVQPSLAEEIGPPSAASASRDYLSIANQTPQLHDTIDSLLLLSQHGSQEVKQTKPAGITIVGYSGACMGPNLGPFIIRDFSLDTKTGKEGLDTRSFSVRVRVFGSDTYTLDLR